MSKKKKHPPHHPVPASPADAARWLTEGKHKEAIEAYKQLLKTDPRQEWRDALATAYLERAKALANKNMFKEASALWETRAGFCGNAGPLELYLTWLLRAGRYGIATRLYLENAEKLPDTEDTRQLPALLGALLLTGQPELVQSFPEDSPYSQQCVAAKAALRAYCCGEEEVLETHLKQIPFRSPYRDFRTLLKALQLFHTDFQEALILLEKIPPASPYHGLVDLMTLPTTQLETFNALNSTEKTVVACLKGWGKEHLQLIPKFQTKAVRETCQGLFDVVVAHQTLLGREFARRICLALLPSYPPLTTDYERIFREPQSEFTKKRLEALYFEHDQQFDEADKKWREAVEILKRESAIPDHQLKAAMILRHLADLWKEKNDTIADLEASLVLDPEDKATYLRVAELYRHQGELKKSYQWIDTAVKRFPGERDVLTAAMEVATQKKAFKKAVGFANTLLKVDPINVKARQTLLSSHLSHARKMIKSGRYDLAWKELTQATTVEKSHQKNGVIQIQQGLIWLKDKGQKESARQSLQEGFQLAGGGLRGYLRVLMEAKLVGPKKLEEQALSLIPPLEPKYLPQRQEVLEWVSLINAYHEDGASLYKKTKLLIPFDAPLQNAVQHDFSRDELISICHCFKQIAHYEWLKQYARLALRKWPEQPIFVFYQIVAKAAGQWYHILLVEEEIERLQKAMETAEQQGDSRTSMMIVGFLGEMARQQNETGSGGFSPLDMLFDGEEEGDVGEDELLLSDEELDQMLEMMERMGMPMPPDLPQPHSHGGKKRKKK